MQNLEQLKTKADQLATELAANDAANAAEHAASVELLHKVIAIAKPAVRGVGDKFMVREVWGSRCESVDVHYSGGRVIALNGGFGAGKRETGTGNFAYHGTDYALNERGEIIEVEWSGHLSQWDGATSERKADVKVVTADEFTADRIGKMVGRLCDAITSAGSRADATKTALTRAEKLKALAALL